MIEEIKVSREQNMIFIECPNTPAAKSIEKAISKVLKPRNFKLFIKNYKPQKT